MNQGPVVDNYTSFIQQQLQKWDRKNPFLSVQEVENRHERLNNLLVQLSKVKVLKNKKAFIKLLGNLA